jgi:uncharacterized protein YjbI with pentapeptide repeats
MHRKRLRPWSDFSDAHLRSANFPQRNVHNADFRGADLEAADLWAADLSGADFSEATLASADLRNANLPGIHWRDLGNRKETNIYGVKNARDSFHWALPHGAIQSRLRVTTWRNGWMPQ